MSLSCGLVCIRETITQLYHTTIGRNVVMTSYRVSMIRIMVSESNHLELGMDGRVVGWDNGFEIQQITHWLSPVQIARKLGAPQDVHARVSNPGHLRSPALASGRHHILDALGEHAHCSSDGVLVGLRRCDRPQR